MRWIAPKPLITILLFVIILSWGLGRIYAGPEDLGWREAAASIQKPTVFPSVELPSFLVEPNEQALAQLVALEREAANRRDLALLAQLWDAEGQVVDGRATSVPEDDYRWLGQRAVLDRYRVLVFPNPPPLRTNLPRLRLQREKDKTDTLERAGSVSLQKDETQIIAIDLDNGDEWQFRFHHGRWWLLVLRYATRPA